MAEQNNQILLETKDLQKHFPIKDFFGRKKQAVKAVDGITFPVSYTHLIAGSHKNKWADKLIDGICAIGIALPNFWVSMLLMYFLGYKLNVLPIVGMHTIGQENSMIDYLRHFLMPFIALFLSFLPDATRYVLSLIHILYYSYCIR